MKRAERRIEDARQRMLDLMVEAGVDPASLIVIQRPAPSRGRIRDLWARVTGRNVELVARRVVR